MTFNKHKHKNSNWITKGIINSIKFRDNVYVTVKKTQQYMTCMGGGPRVVVSTAAFHARVRGSVPGLGGLKETKLFLPHPRVKVSIVGSLRDREVAYSASDRQGSNFESCVWRTVSSQSSHHPQEVLLAQFSLYVHKGGLKPDSFHFIFYMTCITNLRTYNTILNRNIRISKIYFIVHVLTNIKMILRNLGWILKI